MDYGFAQRAIESLGTTIADLSKRYVWELDDAIDTYVTEPMTVGERWELLAALKESLWQNGAEFKDGDRFQSYDEMAQWLVEAANARGFAMREQTEGESRRLSVDVPGGTVSFGYDEKISFGFSASEAEQPRVAKLGRDLLRAAQTLQNDA